MEIKVFNSEDEIYNIYVEASNSKLGNISNFSVKKGINAYCNKDCNKCYCNHMKMYTSHSEHVDANFNAIDDSKNDLVLYINIVDAICNYIKLEGCNIFRFNVEGDISSNYLNIIIEVAKNSPGCAIYLYTKNYNIINDKIHSIECINNLTILLSVMNFNDSYIIEKFKKYDNIKFFITTRNRAEELTYYKTYHLDYFDVCKNDNNKNMKCNGCGLCFDHDSKFIFNQYRGIKKVDKKIVPCSNLFLKTVNRFNNNNFLKSALHESLITIFCNTTATKKELENLNKLVDIKIRSFSKNAKKQYGQCEKLNNRHYKITINNMDYYKTICVLIHELLHVLVFNDGHSSKFDQYAKEIEENTIFMCRGAKIRLNDINYKNSLELEEKLIYKTIDLCTTYLLSSSLARPKNQLMMEFSNNIFNYFDKMDAQDLQFSRYTNLRSIITRTVKTTLKKEYSNILENIND